LFLLTHTRICLRRCVAEANRYTQRSETGRSMRLCTVRTLPMGDDAVWQQEGFRHSGRIRMAAGHADGESGKKVKI
jgi:hypothetical protein